MSEPQSQRSWPAAFLASELRRLNRIALREHANPLIRGKESWPNQQPSLRAEQLSLAQSLGMVPLSPEEPGFQALMERGERFNWAVRLDGTLRVTPSIVATAHGPARISHAVLSSGNEDVLAAGEGRSGDFLSNTTGHYKNGPEVVDSVKKAFEQIGVFFRR